MTPEILLKDRTMMLIAFSIENQSFSIAQALSASGMGFSAFVPIGQAIYTDGSGLSHEMNLHEVRQWSLRPEALFGYMSLKEFERSVASAREAKWIALSSIAISGLLALGSIVVSLSDCCFFNWPSQLWEIALLSGA